MRKLTLGLFFLVSLEAHAVPAVVCQAQCVALNRNNHTFVVIGNLSGVEIDKHNAWKVLNRSCKNRVAKFGAQPVLAKGIFRMDSDQSSSGSSSVEHNVTYGYDWVSEGIGYSSSFYQADKLSVEMDLATAEDSCKEEDLHPSDLVPEYDGDLPVFGSTK